MINALQFARIQHELGIAGTYYFRFLPNHFSKDIIREIASLGHEIGYHYDDLSHCHGNYEEALKRFEKNLATLREIAPVTTICMEGAPLSKWDNREMWSRATSRKPQAASSELFALRPLPRFRNRRRTLFRSRFLKSAVSHRHRQNVGRGEG
jgi:hypothetical protein